MSDRNGLVIVCGNKYWYKDNEFHRLDGPAIEYIDGTTIWYQNGIVHRKDGPAVIYDNGKKEYWLDNIYYPDVNSDEEWLIFQIIN